MEFSDQIKTLRKEKQLTQEALAVLGVLTMMQERVELQK